MPHVHKTTEVYTRQIEDTIDQLLERGAVISRALDREMEYARRPSRQHIPCSRSHQSTMGATTITYQPTQQSTKLTQTDESRLPCERVVPAARCGSKITVATTTTRTEKRIVDPETRVEMRCYSIDKKSESSGNLKPSVPSSCCQQSTIQASRKTTTTVGSSGQESKPSAPSKCNQRVTIQASRKTTAAVGNSGRDYKPSAPSTCNQQATIKASRKKTAIVGSSGQKHKQSSSSSCYQQSTIRTSTKTTKTTAAVSGSRDVVARSKEEREGWKKIFTHEGSDLLKGNSFAQECRVKTVIYQSNNVANKWLRVNQQWTANPSHKILNLWTDVLNGKVENTWVNGKAAKM